MEIKVFNTGIYSVNTLLVHIDEKNVFVVDPAGCIETQDEKIVSDYIKQNSLSLSGILLTHGHFDHITGTKILKHDFENIKIRPMLKRTVNALPAGDLSGKRSTFNFDEVLYDGKLKICPL